MNIQTQGMRLKNKAVIVTGGGHGIGRVFCLGLAVEDAKVVVVDIDKGKADKVANAIQGKGGEALSIKADI